MDILSKTNAKVKYVRRLQDERRFRVAEKAFVVEGSRWLQELRQAKIEPHFILYTPQWADVHLLGAFSSPKFTISAELLRLVSDVETPPGVLAVVEQPRLLFPPRPSFLLILDRLQNPGNLGTILRTAAAAGVEGVVLSEESVDPFNPKVVRGSMGALLRVPVVVANSQQLVSEVAHLALYSAVVQPVIRYTAVDWCKPSALIIGNEARGTSAEFLPGTQPITIPMAAATESLNAAVATAVILFEVARQRGHVAPQ